MRENGVPSLGMKISLLEEVTLKWAVEGWALGIPSFSMAGFHGHKSGLAGSKVIDEVTSLPS